MIAPEVLLQGYRLGVFPMAMEDGEIEWFSPNPRGILPLDDGFHVPHALERVLRKNVFEVRINTAFGRVMEHCAKRPDTWINGEIIRSYTHLHEIGHAHSVETWQEGKLVGGLYGVSVGGAFFGESMFHTVTDASKVALCALVERLRAQRFSLLDTQWLTPAIHALARALRRSCALVRGVAVLRDRPCSARGILHSDGPIAVATRCDARRRHG